MSKSAISPFFFKWLKSLPAHAKDVLFFFLLLFGFHFIYIGWSQGLNFWPVEAGVMGLFEWVAKGLLRQGIWVLRSLGIDAVVVDQIIFANDYKAYVSVVPECTTLKQWMHWMVIISFFPGRWKHKLWYIPLGILIIHFTNIVRISGLVLIQFSFPNGFDFFHTFFFKTLFYAVIFLMWLLWNEKIRNWK